MTFQDDVQEISTNSSSIIYVVQSELKDAMKREITFMREMLTSMQKEHDTLLLNNTLGLKMIMQEREELFESLIHARNERMRKMQLISQILQLDEANDNHWEEGNNLDQLLSKLGVEGCEILWLRDQTLALLKKMNEQNSHNNYLIQNRIRHTKEMMQRLDLQFGCHTYCDDGKYAKKNRIKTTLINQEG